MRSLRFLNRLTAVKSPHERPIFMFRQISSFEPYKNLQYVRDIIRVSIRNHKLLEELLTVKHQSKNILKSWVYQCECVLAQRLRRTQQMFCLYSRLWGERRWQQFLKQIQQHATIRTRDLLLASIGIGVYDWQTNRIPESEILQHKYDLDYVHLLKKKTACQPVNDDTSDCSKVYDTWTIFIQEEELLVWRRMDESGYYEYKVYGRYKDVSAEDFLNVQVDTQYRKKWDTTAVHLEVIETDPESNSDIVYWEMLWPKLFANRDYVFNRRYLVETDPKTIFLVNKSTKHPACPLNNSKFRIENYWSVMVIKPFTEFNQLGIEFSLTYFDNPGVNLPSAITTWVALKAMPEFLSRLREASKQYKSYCSQEGVSCYCDVMKPSKQTVIQEEVEEKTGWELYEIDDVIIDNTIFEAQVIIKRTDRLKKEKDTRQTPPSKNEINEPKRTNHPEIEQNPEPTPPPPPPPISHSFWRYLHPMYYFS